MKLRVKHLLVVIVFLRGIWAVATMAAPASIVRANNQFALDLYSQLAKQPGNLVVSPFSIDTALTMAYAGARGNTARQMSQVLHYHVATPMFMRNTQPFWID